MLESWKVVRLVKAVTVDSGLQLAPTSLQVMAQGIQVGASRANCFCCPLIFHKYKKKPHAPEPVWSQNFGKTVCHITILLSHLCRNHKYMEFRIHEKRTTLLLAFSIVLHLMLLLLIDPQLYIPTTQNM
jgi:hypothetical protein